MNSTPKVLVIHSGARHNYALPAILAKEKMLAGFYTDISSGGMVSKIATLTSKLTKHSGMRSLALGVLGRRVPPPVRGLARSDWLSSLFFEIGIRSLNDPTDKRIRRVRHSVKRGQRLKQWGLHGASHILNVYGEGGELVKEANARNIPVISDVIIAPSTDEIHWREYEEYLDWGPPPPEPARINRENFNAIDHLINTTDVFIAPSDFVAEDLERNFSVSRDRIHVVPYALKDEWFESAPNPEVGRVLFVGTADRRKGIHYLAEAANLLEARGRNYQFDVIGSVDDAVRFHPSAKNLRFHGVVPRALIKKWFESADVFVLPSLAEGSATVIYEAMAVGVPVVTTKAAGSKIVDQENGRIVKERDAENLADAIEELIQNRPYRDRIAQAGRRLASQWTWSTYSKSLLKIIADTTANPDLDK